jgi:hypothetical protein
MREPRGEEARLDAGKTVRISVAVPSTTGFDRLLQGLIRFAGSFRLEWQHPRSQSLHVTPYALNSCNADVPAVPRPGSLPPRVSRTSAATSQCPSRNAAPRTISRRRRPISQLSSSFRYDKTADQRKSSTHSESDPPMNFNPPRCCKVNRRPWRARIRTTSRVYFESLSILGGTALIARAGMPRAEPPISHQLQHK